MFGFSLLIYVVFHFSVKRFKIGILYVFFHVTAEVLVKIEIWDMKENWSGYQQVKCFTFFLFLYVCSAQKV